MRARARRRSPAPDPPAADREHCCCPCSAARSASLLAQWLLGALSAADLPLPLPVGQELSLDVAAVLVFTAALAIATGCSSASPRRSRRRAPTSYRRRERERAVAATSAEAPALLGLRQRAGRLAGSTVAGDRSSPPACSCGAFRVRIGSIRDSRRATCWHDELQSRPRGLHAGTRAGVLSGDRRTSVDAAGRPPRRWSHRMLRLAADEAQRDARRAPTRLTRDRILVQVNRREPGYYLDALGVPLQRGRDFADTDVDGAPPGGDRQRDDGAAVLARRGGARQDASSSSATRTSPPSSASLATRGTTTVAEDPTPFIYQPLRQNYSPATRCTCVRSAGAAALAACACAARSSRLDPTLSVFNVRTLEDQVSRLAGTAADQHRFCCRSSGCWRWCSHRWASTAWPTTRSRSARVRLASAWRSARNRRRCCGWFSPVDCSSSPSGSASASPWRSSCPC